MRPLRSSPVRRLRLFVARRPLVHWLLIATAAAVTAAFILDRAAAADAARERWGDTRTVVVATVDLRPGQRIGAADTRTENWPIALVPADALSALPDDAVVAASIGRGEPVARRRLGRAGAGPIASRLPAGTRGLSVPVGDTPPVVEPGDRVDIVAADLGVGPRVVATDAEVVAVDARSVVVAVAVDELGAVAGALVAGSVVLAVSGDPPSPG